MQILAGIVFYLALFQTSLCALSQEESCKLYRNCRFEWWGTDCGKFCHQMGQRVRCEWHQYHMGCFCKKGFFRNRKWDCVPAQGCDADTPGHHKFPKPLPTVDVPKDCPANEVWKRCDNRCANLCESINNPSKCEKEKCEQGCFCKPGMLRNYNGACIKSTNCKVFGSSGKLKYKYSMSVSNSLYKKKWWSHKKWWTKKKKYRKCKKRPGYTSCRPEDEYEDYEEPEEQPVANEECQENELYTTCGDKCLEQCRNLYMSENCPLKCDTGCYCKIGFYRNNQGRCVRPQQCEGYHEKQWLTTTTTRRPPVVTRTTTPAPVVVVRPTFTTTSTTTEKPKRNVSDSECPENERWSQCDSHCKERCENAPPNVVKINVVVTRARKGQGKCSPNMNCEQGCFCEEGHYRNETDACVPAEECPPPPPVTKPPIKCAKNEEYTTCGSKCGESCDVFNDTKTLDCPPTCEVGCFCIQGFFKDNWGQCVPQDQCTCELEPQKCRDPQEEYTVCGKNCRRTCDIKNPECKETCARGCFCKEGYVYNENGVCTLPVQCGLDIRNGTKEGKRKIVKPPSKCPNDNERWSECGDMCHDYCDPKFDVETCPFTCENGCFCRKGYKRNAIDQCVPEAKCDEKPTCGEFEVYSECGTSCGTSCKDIGRNRNCDAVCQKGCFCQPGYFRDYDGIKCIPRGRCVIDTTPECTTHEVYKNCSTRCGEGCEDLREPVKCPKPEEECEKGCFCDKDYYRDDEGYCGPRVGCNLPEPVTETPDCEANEYYKECGNRCEESCEDSIRCTKTCENGCFCIEDYLRNKKGKCVASEDCTGPPQCAECKQNEYYTECGTDCGRMCSDLTNKNRLVCDKDTPCHPGCVCKYGFFRTPEGDCVTRNECQFFMDDDDEAAETARAMQAARNKVKSFSSRYLDDYDDYQDDYVPDYDHYDSFDDNMVSRELNNNYFQSPEAKYRMSRGFYTSNRHPNRRRYYYDY